MLYIEISLNDEKFESELLEFLDEYKKENEFYYEKDMGFYYIVIEETKVDVANNIVNFLDEISESDAINYKFIEKYKKKFEVKNKDIADSPFSSSVKEQDFVEMFLKSIIHEDLSRILPSGKLERDEFDEMFEELFKLEKSRLRKTKIKIPKDDLPF